MKYAILLACFLATAYACVHDDSDGKPLCNGVTTIVGNNYRNHFDVTRYWHCESLNNAVSVRCPDSLLYYQVQDKCVTSGVWRWTPPCKPDA